MHVFGNLVVLCLSVLVTTHAQYQANDYQPVARFNNSIYYEGPGGYQEVLYQDSDSDFVTEMVWIRIYIEPCGVELPQMHNGFTELSYIQQGTVVGGLIIPEMNIAGHHEFSAGAVVTVPRSAIHSAENPSCTEPVILLQAQSGGPRFQHTDVLSALVGMSPSALQYGLHLPDGQVRQSASEITPIFALNTDCLQRCGIEAPAPAPGQ